MIYVIQRNSTADDFKPIYAGSSAHQALMAASQHTSCRITLWRDGKKFIVTQTKSGE